MSNAAWLVVWAVALTAVMVVVLMIREELDAERRRREFFERQKRDDDELYQRLILERGDVPGRRKI